MTVKELSKNYLRLRRLALMTTILKRKKSISAYALWGPRSALEMFLLILT